MAASNYESVYDDCIISTNQEKLDISLIWKYLSVESYWAQNIPLKTVERAVRNSLSFGVYINDEQIGFARVISDFATFAYLADVFILSEYRGKGYSKKLIEAIHSHPDLQELRSWLLQTKDAHGLYQQFGWGTHDQPERIMRIRNNGAYKKEE